MLKNVKIYKLLSFSITQNVLTKSKVKLIIIINLYEPKKKTEPKK